MKAVKLFIWLGFIALLAVSIPKVAWVFRLYEGSSPLLITTAGKSLDVLWIVPFFVALGIDALTLVLTYALKNDRSKVGQAGMWAFVGLLAALSYYCNLLYNDASVQNNGLVHAITPFILSAVPLFALCYTLVLSRIEGKGETLQEKVIRLQSEQELRNQLAQLKQGKLTGSIKSFIGGGAELVQFTRETFQNRTEPNEQRTEPSSELANCEENSELESSVVLPNDSSLVDSELAESSLENNKQNGHSEETENLPIVHLKLVSSSEQLSKKQQVLSILEQNEQVSVTELVNQTGVTKSYASSLRTQFLEALAGRKLNGHKP